MRKRHSKGGALRKRYGRAFTAKPLAFPHVRSFHDLFSSARPWRSSDLQGRGAKVGKGREANTVGHYLVMSGRGGHESFYVTPTSMVTDYIASNMLAIGDRLHFEIVNRSDGALVIVSHGKILGSRWLAMVDPSTLPPPEEE